jgi:hypothetical protein
VPDALIKLGAGILRLVLDYDTHTARGLPVRDAIAAIRTHTVRHDSALVDSLEAMVGPVVGTEVISEVSVGRVTPGMVFFDDLRISVGTLLVPKGFEVTETFLERVRNFGPGILQERVRVVNAPKHGS